MGYNLTIGEACVDYNVDDSWFEQDYNDYSIRVEARSEKHDAAPAFGEPTDHTNQRWPSYTAWHNFCKFTNLYDLFYDDNERTLRGGHPGVMPVTKHMLFRVKKAKMQLKGKYPNLRAEYDVPDISEEEDMANGALCRLLWLEYWFEWALENCEQPVLTNS
jgi:hypothetical protein